MTSSLVPEIAKTAVLMGVTLSAEQISVFARVLSEYPLETSIRALRSVALNEDRFTLAKINKYLQLNDNRPSIDQAWTLMPKDENYSGAVTGEMSKAWAVCAESYEAGDTRSAEISFKREYKTAVEDARASGEPCKWSFSPGWDSLDRQRAAVDAALAGRIGVDDAFTHINSDEVKLMLVKKAQAANLLTSEQAKLMAPSEPDEEGLKEIKRRIQSAYTLIGE